MKTVSLFGATGSIGQNSAEILKREANTFETTVLTACKNVTKLSKMARELRPDHVVIQDDNFYNDLKNEVSDLSCEVHSGDQALLDAAAIDVDVSVQGIVGYAGVKTSFVAACHSKTLALANKESLVCAGNLLKRSCESHGTSLVPVDSEHSAIFQCLLGEKRDNLDRVILTASGGPFLNFTKSEMTTVTPKEAANHPNWSMGKRISIDSASMFNKAMEMIEAKVLFDLTSTQVEVIIHPQSIIHSMVGFCDGSIIAHLGPTDMKGPIGYALYYPDRPKSNLEPLNFADVGRLDFQKVDEDSFPAIRLARMAMELGPKAGTIFNAAKEKALDLFLEKKIGFLDMALLVERQLESYSKDSQSEKINLADLDQIDRDTRSAVQSSIN